MQTDRLLLTRNQEDTKSVLALAWPSPDWCLITLGLLFLFSCKQQQAPVPILIEPKAEIDSLIDLAWDSKSTDPIFFRKYGHEALMKSLVHNYVIGEGDAYQILGTYYYRSGVPDSALYFFQLALEKRKELGDSLKIFGTLNNMGLAFNNNGAYSQSLKYYQQAAAFIPFFKDIKRARLNDNIGAVYHKIGQYAEALKCNTAADSIFRIKIPFSIDQGICFINRGNILESMTDYDRALLTFQDAEAIFQNKNSLFNLGKVKNNIGNIFLKKKQLDRAIQFYQEALTIYQTGNYQAQLAGTEQNLGLAYQLEGDEKKALVFFERSLAKWEQQGNLQKQAEVLINQGKLYLSIGEYRKAQKVFLSAQNKPPVNLRLRSELFYGLYSSFAQLRQYEAALPFQQEYKTLIDTLELERIQWQKLNADFVDQQNEIKLLEKDKAISIEQSKKERILNIALLIGLFLVLAVLLFSYLNWQSKKKRFQAEKKALERQQEVERLLKDQELISIRNVLDIQDQERRRIAQDLHDRLGSMLSMVKLHFQKTNKDIEYLKVSNQEAYEKANTLLDEACNEVREIAHNLNSGILKNFGLVAAVEDLKNTLINTGEYEVELVTHQFEERLPPDYETTLFRIVQEIISNVLRHAKATEISIQLLRKADFLHISIEDNGKGMDLKKINDREGMGIKSICSRLLPLEGKLTIDSHLGKGTSVFIELPIKQTI